MDKKRGLTLALLAVLAAVLFTSCGSGGEEPEPAPDEPASLAQAAEPDSRPESSRQAEPSSQVQEEDRPESAAESQAASQAVVSQAAQDTVVDDVSTAAAEEPAASQTLITVTPIAPQGKMEAFAITDSADQDRILELLSTMQPVEPVENPVTGGYFFGLSVTQGETTQLYELSNHDNTPNGHLRIYRDGDDQPYSVDPSLWDVIAESYPAFAR